MSTNWGLQCKTCHVDTGCGDLSNAKIVLRDIVSMTPELHNINQKDTMGYIEISLMGGGHNFIIPPWVFVVDHKDHELELYNEYGDTEPIVVAS